VLGYVPGASAAAGASAGPPGAAFRKQKSFLALDCLEPLEDREHFPGRVLVVVGSPCANCWGDGVCLRPVGKESTSGLGALWR